MNNLLLHTQRLTLRPLDSLKDAPKLNAIRTDEKVQQQLLRNKPESVEETAALIDRITDNNRKGEAFNLGVEFKQNRELIGFAGIWRINRAEEWGELGYMLDSAYWNRGLMKEALQALLSHLPDDLGMEKLHAEVHRDNRYSIRLLDRLGFEKTNVKLEDGYLLYKRTIRPLNSSDFH